MITYKKFSVKKITPFSVENSVLLIGNYSTCAVVRAAHHALRGLKRWF
jgi:hypothetical protein